MKTEPNWQKLTHTQARDLFNLSVYDWEVVLIDVDTYKSNPKDCFHFNAQEHFSQKFLDTLEYFDPA